MSDGRKAAVIGWPVSHSRSPRLMAYWLKHYNIAGSYEAVPVEPGQLETAVARMKKTYAGFNVTIPHKESIMPLLNEIDEEARAIGAVNTVIVEKNGKLRGTNTDVYGFMENLRSSLPSKRGKAVVLGAGGAARAVCHALKKEGYEVTVTNRTGRKAEELAAHLGNIKTEAWDKRAPLLADASLLVNATSLGMAGKEPLEIDLSALPQSALVTDIVYTPLMTKLLIDARMRGNKVVDGIGMLLHQAVPGFEAWFGIRPEVTDALKEHVLA